MLVVDEELALSDYELITCEEEPMPAPSMFPLKRSVTLLYAAPACRLTQAVLTAI